jgi:hypothetical protein
VYCENACVHMCMCITKQNVNDTKISKYNCNYKHNIQWIICTLTALQCYLSFADSMYGVGQCRDLPGELAIHAVSEGTKAVTKFTSSAA